MNPPNVTIVLANHNYDKYIKGAIKSALEQDYPAIRLVIIDDCSTDDSWSTIHNFVFKDKPHKKDTNEFFDTKSCSISRGGFNCEITAYRLKSQVGPSEARNLAIHNFLNVTDFYAILDADDEYYRNKVSELVNTALHSPNIGVVYSDYDILNVDTGNTVREYKYPFSLKRLQEECIVHSGALVSKVAIQSVVEQTGYYDNRLRCAEDYDLWLRIAEKFVIVHVPKSLSLVRTHSENSTNSVKQEIWQNCWNLVAQKFKARHESTNH